MQRHLGTLAQSTATWLGISAGALFVAHLVFQNLGAVPAKEDIFEIDEQGQVNVLDEEAGRFYLEQELPTLDQQTEAIQRYHREVEEGLLVYKERSEDSNEGHTALMKKALDEAEYVEARRQWDLIVKGTSPTTLSRVGDDMVEAIGARLTRIPSQLEDIKRSASNVQMPRKRALAFPWTTRAGAPLEILGLGLCAALSALLFRRLQQQRRGIRPELLSVKESLGYAVGPVLGLITWLVVRDGVTYADAPWIIIGLGIVPALVLPMLTRAVLRFLGRGPEVQHSRQRRQDTKNRIHHALAGLRPQTFAELRDAADDLAKRLTLTEVEESQA